MVIKSTNEASYLPSTSYDDIEICSSQNLMIKTCQNQHDSWLNHMKTSIFWAGWSLDVDRYIAIHGLIYIYIYIYFDGDIYIYIDYNQYIYIYSPCLYIYIYDSHILTVISPCFIIEKNRSRRTVASALARCSLWQETLQLFDLGKAVVTGVVPRLMAHWVKSEDLLRKSCFFFMATI